MIKCIKTELFITILFFLIGFPLLSFSQENEIVIGQNDGKSIQNIVDDIRFDPYFLGEMSYLADKAEKRTKWYFIPWKVGDRIYNYWIRRSFRLLKEDAADFYWKLKYYKEHDPNGMPGFIVYSTVNGAVNVAQGVGLLIYNIPKSAYNAVDKCAEKDYEKAAEACADGLMSGVSAYLAVEGGLQATQASKVFVAGLEANLSRLANIARNLGNGMSNSTPAFVGVTSSGTKIFAQPVVLEAEAVAVGGIALGKNALGNNLTGLVFSRSADFKDDMPALHEGDIDEIAGGSSESSLSPTDEVTSEVISGEEIVRRGKTGKKLSKEQKESALSARDAKSREAIKEMGSACYEEIIEWEAEVLRFYRYAKTRHMSLKSAVTQEIEQAQSQQYYPGLIPKSELVNIIYEKLLEFGFDPPVKPLTP